MTKWLQKITFFHSFMAEYQNLCVLLTHVEVNNEIFNGIIISYFRAYCANHNRENVIIMVGGGEGNIKHYLLCVHSTCRKSYDDKVSSETSFTNSTRISYFAIKLIKKYRIVGLIYIKYVTFCRRSKYQYITRALSLIPNKL